MVDGCRRVRCCRRRIGGHRDRRPQLDNTAIRPRRALRPAPNGPFTAIAGEPTSVRALRGQPVLLWFVTTFCGSCQVGTQPVTQQIGQFAAQHVKVVELELSDNLGGGGPDIATFARTNAQTSLTNRSWLWGTASQQLTSTYDPDNHLDIY